MDDLPLLYSFRRCPYAMRARLAICLGGQQVRLRELILRDKPDHMLSLSEKGTVPVLMLNDGTVIDESLDVMMWAVGKDPKICPPDLMKDMRDIIATNDGPFKHHLDRYKYATRYEGTDADEHRAAGFEILVGLAERLRGGGELTGSVARLVDYAVFPFVRQFRIADPDWFDAQAIPALQHWLQRHCEAGIFKTVMQKFSLWNDSQTEHVFPPLP
ncbi:glutathione S-transferase [Parvularcula sp. LCG005]|uniref:glutathione S-transferase n=1 Tax=Parvularcula sp. LCG005 TaxID=3078805 RepID=UPI002943816B|nr:glutathione S-transferase [Parvularcula sp. LCG005]WOI53437.1 glutathione S-transferase [Parvularcula sp. LCG005]